MKIPQKRLFLLIGFLCAILGYGVVAPLIHSGSLSPHGEAIFDLLLLLVVSCLTTRSQKGVICIVMACIVIYTYQAVESLLLPHFPSLGVALLGLLSVLAGVLIATGAIQILLEVVRIIKGRGGPPFGSTLSGPRV
ncbi:MAG: hypothetical protein AB1714_12895 [Acidobacteriota bacterium]